MMSMMRTNVKCDDGRCGCCIQFLLIGGSSGHTLRMTRIFCLALIALTSTPASSFSGSTSPIYSRPAAEKKIHTVKSRYGHRRDDLSSRVSSPTCRSLALSTYLIEPLRQQWKFVLTAAASCLVWIFRHTILWPNSKSDPSRPEPLPPGSFGCPLFGCNILEGSKKEGPELFYKKASAALGHPPIWKLYFFGNPCIAVSGTRLVSKLQNLEFSKLKAGGSGELFGTDNIMFERDKKQHSFLRKLVGSAMTPAALQKSVPILEEIANKCIDQVLLQAKAGPVKMSTICNDYTMEIVQTQILGFDLDTRDAAFRQNLETFLDGMYSFRINTGIFAKQTSYYKARQYLTRKIGDQVDAILASGDGPCTSTLSKMIYAVDEDGKGKLTREQVIDNVLLLVAAGTETSSSVLTMLMLLLGLHPNVTKKLALEQEEWRSRAGDAMTYEDLNDLPYLDAVVKEALRLGAITGGFPRMATETLVVDGYQIPKGWSVFGNYRLSHYLDPITRKADGSHMDVQKGFLPERWLSPETTPSEFLSFGSGPRYAVCDIRYLIFWFFGKCSRSRCLFFFWLLCSYWSSLSRQILSRR
jgi:cytochrome P450